MVLVIAVGDDTSSHLDPLGDVGFAKIGARHFQAAHEKRVELRLIQAANGDEDDDLVPGLVPPTTYAQRRGQLDGAINRIAAAFEHMAELFEAEVTKIREGIASQ